jgi:hypothetical protein
MRETRRTSLQRLIIGAIAALFISTPSVGAETSVDVALVLAVDISESIEVPDGKVQRDGYLAALRSKDFIASVRAGPIGRIAVTYVEWSGPTEQKQLVPWRVISDAESADSFAAELETHPVRSLGPTSISGGIDFSAQLLKDSGYRATRRIIDISGERCDDCDTMAGRSVTDARDDAVKAGITVNGLQIIFPPRVGKTVHKHITDYFQKQVIGGTGSFAHTVRKPEDFTEALIRKLSLEIAGSLRPQG